MDRLPCRPGCGACCIAPSISSPIPGMPHGKPAGVRCVQLDELQRCRSFGQPGRPEVCAGLMPAPDMCGDSAEAALRWLTALELATTVQPASTAAAQTLGSRVEQEPTQEGSLP